MNVSSFSPELLDSHSPPPKALPNISELYAEQQPWLCAWIQRRTGCVQLSKDLVQDVFVRLLAKQALPPLPEPRAYLIKIAHGLFIDYRRRKRVEQAWLETLAVLPEALHISPEEQALLLDSLARVDALLDGLKPRVREAFLLSRIDGMSYPSIASKLGVSLRTIESDMALALRHCYSMLCE